MIAEQGSFKQGYQTYEKATADIWQCYFRISAGLKFCHS